MAALVRTLSGEEGGRNSETLVTTEESRVEGPQMLTLGVFLCVCVCVWGVGVFLCVYCCCWLAYMHL